MSAKRIVIGQSEWTLPDRDVSKVVEAVESALENGTVVSLELIDSVGRTVNVLLNGRVVPCVTIDVGSGPRPGEVSG